MSFTLRSDAAARLTPDASLLHCTRERPTLLNCARSRLSAGCGSVFSFLCDTYRLLNEVSSFSCCCAHLAIFLLNAAVFVDLALYLAVCGLASSGPGVLVLLPLSGNCKLFSARLRCCLLEVGQHCTWRLRCCLLEVGQHCTWRLRCCLLEVCSRSGNIAPGDCAAVWSRSGQHCTWRLRCCLLICHCTSTASVCSKSVIGVFWTLLRVLVWVVCASHGTCGVAAVFCAILISS